MGLYDFIALDLNQKADKVWNHATYTVARQIPSGYVSLYVLEDFYVEVYYDSSCNCIEDIRSFQSIECLEPYLWRIDLTDLLDF